MKHTLIIGAGIHAQALKSNTHKPSPLVSWAALLNMLGASNYSSPLLGFESLVLQKAKEKGIPAHNAEDVLLKELASIIKIEQEKVLEDSSLDYPLEIFNPKKVSDVILLNFDLVIETLLSKGQLPAPIEVVNSKIGISYREINGIKFWHPHGEVENPEKIQFGLRKYGMNLGGVEELRKLFKQTERDSGYDLSQIKGSWYTAMIYNPLIFIGTSLSAEEWSIWFALTNRKRNYALKGIEQPIYTLNKSGAFCTLHSFTQTIPLTEHADYNEAWLSLIQYLK